MENQIQQNEKVLNRAGIKYKKTIIIIAVIIALPLMFVLWGTFKQWQMRRGVEKFAQALKQLEQDDYRRAMADAYGGKTPQETLQMYIDAVEKGDFELASKYIITSKQQEEFEGLLNIKDDKKFLDKYLGDLKKSKPDGDIKEDVFRMKAVVDKEEGPYYFIRFIKYPNGIWKISEI